MIFVEPISLIYSLSLALSVSSVVFAWRYRILKKKSLEELYSLPSVIVVGQKLVGKSSIIRLITNEDVSRHMFVDDISLYRLMGTKDIIQFVELPAVTDKKGSKKLDLQKFKKLNLKHIIYIFDMSESTVPFNTQLKGLEIIEKTFARVPMSIVANKIQDTRDGNFRQLKKKSGKIYKIPALEAKVTRRSGVKYLKEEAEDVNKLIEDLSVDISRETLLQRIKR